MNLYNGVRLCDGPDFANISRLDTGYMPLLHHMRHTGLPIDPDHFYKMDKILTEDLDRINEKVRDITGYYCNLSSHDQVSDLLFKKLGLKQYKLKLKTNGDESTAYEVLVAIQHDHLAVAHIMEYREVEKLRGTYVRPIPKLAVRRSFGNWVLLPNLSQTRVPSGRNNAKEPNLLAMPNRSKRGRQVCQGFIAPEGWCYLSVDVSQLEPRVSTHLSQDEALMRIYWNNEDIYSDFAIAAFKLLDDRFKCNGYSVDCGNSEHIQPTWHYPHVDKVKHRFPAKTCILASFYEVSGSGLSEQMPVVCKNCEKEATEHDCGKYEALWTEDPCKLLVASFGETYEGVIRMRMRDHKEALRSAMVADMWGRILHVAAVRSVHPWVVNAALREAANFKIQGGGRGLVKLGETKIFDGLKMGNMLGDIVNPVLDVHDELLCLVREDEADAVGHYCIKEFEDICPLTVPIKAGMAKAANWGSMKK